MSGKRGIGRTTRLGVVLNFSAMALAAIAIVVLANLLASLPGIWRRFDLTAREQNTLAPQTVKILESLPGEVEVLTFLKAEREFAAIVEDLDLRLWRLLKQFHYYSKGKLTHEKHRLDQGYAAARTKLQELEIKDEDNLVVVRRKGPGGRARALRLFPDIALATPARHNALGQLVPPKLDLFRAEEALNGAILAVTEEKRPRIGFLVNHGEYSIAEEKAEGLLQFAEDLRKVGYEPFLLDLRQNAGALRETAVVAAVGPRTPLDASEWKALREYLDGGGRILVALHPVAREEEDSDFLRLLKDWGLTARLGVVCEPLGGHYGIPECANLFVLDGLSPLHPITKKLREVGIRVLFPVARGLDKAEQLPPDVLLYGLASTGVNAWDDLRDGRPLVPDPGRETIGLRTVAYGVEREGEKPMRAVVLGTPTMFVNEMLPASRDFLRNAVSWLADRENLISVAPKPPERQTMAWSEGRRDLFFWVCLVVFPAGSLALGLAVWVFRRRSRS